MRYICLIIITVTLNLFFATTALSQEVSYAELDYINIADATTQEYMQIYAIVNCFKVYTDYFDSSYTLNDKNISLYAEVKDEALLYLRQGFNEEVARRIIDYYTTWDSNLNRQIILCQEGIPVFTLNDINRCVFNIENDRITLQVNYFDSYELGDEHIYYITAHKGEGQWLINDLQWIKL